MRRLVWDKDVVDVYFLRYCQQVRLDRNESYVLGKAMLSSRISDVIESRNLQQTGADLVQLIRNLEQRRIVVCEFAEDADVVGGLVPDRV